MVRIIPGCVALMVSLVLAAPQAAGQAAEDAIARSVDDQALQWGPCPAFMPEGCEIAVLHGDPAEANADIFYRVPGGAEIPRHWHTSPERMALVSGRLEVAYDDQEPVVLERGTYAYGPAKKPHSATCLSSEACTLFIAFVDPIDAMQGAPQ